MLLMASFSLSEKVTMNFRKGFYWEKETVASNIVTSQKEISSSNHPFSGAFAVSFREGNHRRPVKPVFWLQVALTMTGCYLFPSYFYCYYEKKTQLLLFQRENLKTLYVESHLAYSFRILGPADRGHSRISTSISTAASHFLVETNIPNSLSSTGSQKGLQ